MRSPSTCAADEVAFQRYQVAVARHAVDYRLRAHLLRLSMTAIAIALMCVRAMGLSPTFRQSTPASFSSFAPSRIGLGVQASRRVDFDGDDEATGRQLLAQRLRLRSRRAAPLSMTTGRDRRASRRRCTVADWPESAWFIAAMCSGVVPQQPPTIDAPASTKRNAYSAERLRRPGVDYRLLPDLRLAGVRLRRKLRGLRHRQSA